MNKRELRKYRDDYTSWVGPAITEGIRLAVHFDEKDHVKRIGGRWAPDPSGKGGYWWVSHAKIDSDMVTGIPALMPAIINTFELADSVKLEMEQDNYSGPTAKGTVLEWLNANKMVNGSHGRILENAALAAIEGIESTEYYIRNIETDEYGHFYIFEDAGIASWTPDGNNPNYNRNLMTMDEAHLFWEDKMAAGYRLVISEDNKTSPNEEVSA